MESSIRVTPDFQFTEFIAEEGLIEIIPEFTTVEPIRFIYSEIGPFRKRIPIFVPLWVAVHLEQRGRCSIVPPGWLVVDEIKKIIQEEKILGENSFNKIDENFYETSTILLNRDYLRDDSFLGGSAARDRLRILIDELFLLRKIKKIEGLKTFDFTVNSVDVSNMVALERNIIREQASMMMDTMRRYISSREE
jgi:GINS complex subunit 2